MIYLHGQILVWYVREHVDRVRLQLVQVLLAHQTQGHQVGRVVTGVELEKLVANIKAELLGLGLQSAQVAGAELRVRMIRATGGLLELVYAPGIRLQVLLVLRVDGEELALGRARVEKRRYEELSESRGGMDGEGVRCLFHLQQ